MGTSSEVKSRSYGFRDLFQGRSFHDNLLLTLNGLVVLFCLQSVICGVLFLVITPLDLNQFEYFRHGFEHVHLFYSLWGSGAQTIYFFAMFAIAIMELYSKYNTNLYKTASKIKTAVGYLFFTATFPMSVSICSLFWGMYFIDRELIYPKALDEIYPNWINHSMHSIPGILMFLYIILEKHNEPPMKHTLLGMIGILIFYGICVIYVKQRDNKWMYYGLHRFNDEQVNNLLIAGAVSNIFCTLLGHDLNDLINIWRKQKKD